MTSPRAKPLFLFFFALLITFFSFLGLAEFFAWFTTRELLFLYSLLLLLMAMHFRTTSPKRDEVSPAVTSGLAVFAGCVALIAYGTSGVGTSALAAEKAGFMGMFILTVVIWFWYDFIFLESYTEE